MHDHKNTLLVVDDEEPMRLLLQESLIDHYHVLLASDALEGMVLFSNHSDKIKAVITDIRMPLIDGGKLVDHIRATDKEVPIICITALCDQEIYEKLHNFYKLQIIKKPFSPQDLLNKIDQLP